VAVDGAEFSGKNVEEAIVKAEAQLGARRHELNVTVITPGSRGVFGIGAEPARIRVSLIHTSPANSQELVPESSDEVSADQTESGRAAIEAEVRETAAPAPQETVRPASQITIPPDEDMSLPSVEQATGPMDATARAETADDLAEAATTVLQTLLNSMGFNAQVSVRSVDDPVILAVSGDNLGILIGRRGDNLSSLQFMVNLILSKGRRQWPRVVIDVENYRARREESLRSLAERIAFRVGRQRRAFTLEAMPATDRRIIHLALREREDVETYSIGEGISRRVVVAPIGATRPDGEVDRSEGYQSYS
jgi:spoIIIJ-associated protein